MKYWLKNCSIHGLPNITVLMFICPSFEAAAAEKKARDFSLPPQAIIFIHEKF